MPDDHGTSRGRSWRAAAQTNAASSPTARRLKRVFFTALGAVLIVLFGVWLIRPLMHPYIHFLCLPVIDYRFLSAPPIEFAEEDIRAFEPLKASLHGGEPPVELRNSQTTAGMDKLAAELNGHVLREKDVLIFYVSAHGVSDDGTAYLLSSGYDPSKGDEGRYKLSDLLNQIHACRARLKLLLLDAGRIASDSRLGMAVNEFPRLLREEVKQLDDPTLWVLGSNSSLETSWVHYPAKRSVFGYFVAEGLKGAADAAGTRDKKVDLKELWEYVGSHVAAWVQEASDGTATQTPILLHAAEETPKPTKQLVLMPVPRLPKEPAKEEPSSPPADEKQAAPEKPASASIDAPARQLAALLAHMQNEAPAQAKPASEGAPAKPTANAEATQEKKAADTTTDSKSDAKSEPAQKETAIEPDKSAATPDVAAGDADRQSMRDALRQLWELRDRLLAVPSDTARWPARPIDYAPHLWREFQEVSLEYERRYLAGSAFNLKKEAADLLGYVRSIEQLSEQRTRSSDRSSGERLELRERLVRADPRVAFAATPQYSTAVTRLLARSADRQDADMSKLMEKFNAIDEWKPSDFRAWASDPALRTLKAAWTEGNPIPIEMAAAFRLEQALANARSEDADALWSAMKTAIRTRRLAEQLASYTEWCRPWIADRVEKADSQLVEAERLLARGLGTSVKPAEQKLAEAERDYLLARQDAELIRSAISLKNDLVFLTPYYVRSPQLVAEDEVASLLRNLRDFSRSLDDPAIGLRRIADQKQRLDRQHGELQQSITTQWAAIVSGNVAELSDARRIKELLDAPLLDAPSRMKLLDTIAASPSATELKVKKASGASPRALTVADWQRAAAVAGLEIELAGLADFEPANSTDSASALAGHLKQAQEALRQITDSLDSVRSGAVPAEKEAEIWTAFRSFGSSVKQFYAGIPGALGQGSDSTRTGTSWRLPEPPGNSMPAWRLSERLLRLVDARDARLVEEPRADRPNAIGMIHRAALYDLIAWHRQRLLDASQEEVSLDYRKLLRAMAENSRQHAESIGPRIAVAAQGEGLKIRSVDELTLEEDSVTSLVLELSIPRTEQSGAPIDATVTLEYDPRLIEVTRSGGQRLPGAADSGHRELTMPLRPGSPTPLVLDLRALSESNQATLLVCAVRAGEGFDARELTVTLPKPIPVVVLAHPAIAGTSADRGRKGIRLQPFPLGSTAYTFYVQNRSGQPKESVQIELLRVLSAPPGKRTWEELPRDPAGNLSPAVPVQPVALEETAVKLPDDKPVPIKLAAAKAEKPLDGPSLLHGLIAAVTVDGKKSFTRIELEPLHPEKYIKPRVSYDADQGMINIRVAPLDRDLFPPEGSTIVWDIEPDDLDPGTSRKDQGRILDPDGVANLWAAVQRDPDRVVTVRLTVDDYPRAFIYQVKCNDSATDIPPDTKVRRVKIADPPSRKKPVAFDAPRDAITVKLLVDAPHGFPAADALIELTGTPRGIAGSEPQRVRRFSDRQTTLTLEETTSAGVIKVHSRVQDFQIDLPTVGLSDVLYQIRPRLLEGTRETAGEPVDVYLDATPPVIAAVETSPSGRVEQGVALRILADVIDEESDVETVRVAFCDKVDDFDKKGPIDAKLRDQSGGMWVADLPTDKLQAGASHKIMVEAVNRVGKKRFDTAQVLIAARGDKAASSNVTVTGKVLLNDKPRPDVDVTLIPLVSQPTPENQPRTTKSDKNGNFRFADVAPGDYRVYARGISANARLQGEAKVSPPKTREAIIHLGF